MLLTKEIFFVVFHAGIAKIIAKLLQNPAILIAFIFAIFKDSTL